ncbi:MAG: hypothetical protein ACE148_02250 [Vicinamibacterales bacterium]
MKAAFPHMGYVYVNLGALARHLGAELCLAPRPSRQSVANGVRHSPEQFCFPFKANLGDLMASLDAGAEVLISVQGAWSCRFGYYGRLHHAILKDLGYRFESLIIDGSRESIEEVAGWVKRVNGCSTAAAVRRFVHGFRVACKKGKLVQRVQQRARVLRAVEVQRGSADRTRDRLIERIDAADEIRALDGLDGEIENAFRALPVEMEGARPRIMMVGEVYIVLEPLVNMDAERRLGEMGSLVDVYIDEHKWFIHAFRMGKGGKYGERKAHKLATPYLKYNLGGEDKNTIGYTVIASQRGFDGVAHFKPFTCMPEGMAKHILYNVSRDHDIPFVSFTVDEHSGEAGFETRLEAFVEMLRQRAGREASRRGGVASARGSGVPV